MSGRKTSISIVDITKLTVSDLIQMMARNRMGHLLSPMGEDIYLHVAILHDAEESAKMQGILSNAVEISIAKKNARYEAEHGPDPGSNRQPN